ncbi:MAG: cytochrome c biogenesis heme-transporting ATPase CcmA [Burkholderiales bacterium]
MLQVSALCCLRGEREIFRDLSFSVGPGHWAQVRGQNGAGKTTLLRTLAGLICPASGDITWKGIATSAIRDQYCCNLCFLGHANGIKDDLDCVENLEVWRAIAACKSNTGSDAALRSLGLEPTTRPTRQLSQGQKRRVALARLALTEAKLWILDEPFAALDDAAIENVAKLMDRHLANGGILVLSSHQPVPLSTPGMDVLIAAQTSGNVSITAQAGEWQ